MGYRLASGELMMLKRIQTILCVVLLCCTTTFAAEDTKHWDSRAHQLAIVKATSLMPGLMQRQILKHRGEILQGCLDVLKELPEPDKMKSQLLMEFTNTLEFYKNKGSFSGICYRLGRLSALVTELNASHSSCSLQELVLLNSFLVKRLKDFPIVIHRIGEEALNEENLERYLNAVQNRNQDQAASLRKALESSAPATWDNERSAMYGIAQLIYNDMIVDTARIWLYAWQKMGGSIENAPYFQQ
jgi:hypothetical protein